MKNKEKERIMTPNGVRKVGQKYFGKCAICGKFGELSKEHIPPRCTFNKERFNLVTGNELLTNGELLWTEDKKLNTITIQGGIAYYSLCSTCNTNTGLLYTNAYKDFIMALHSILVNNNFKVNDCIKITIPRIKPLNIFKQIVSMFNTIYPEIFKIKNFDMEKYLLDKNELKFCDGIYFYIFLTKNITRIPWQGQGNVITGNFNILSEICHYPLGIIMSVDKELEGETCINSFSVYDYDEEADYEDTIFLRERNLTIARDYRTKEELKNIVDDK